MEQGITVVITGATTSVIIEKLKANLAGFSGGKAGAPENKQSKAPKQTKAEEIDDADLDLSSEDADLDSELDSETEAEEPTGPTKEDVRQALLALGKKKGADAAKAVMSKFNCKSMTEAQAATKKFDAIILAAKKALK